MAAASKSDGGEGFYAIYVATAELQADCAHEAPPPQPEAEATAVRSADPRRPYSSTPTYGPKSVHATAQPTARPRVQVLLLYVSAAGAAVAFVACLVAIGRVCLSRLSCGKRRGSTHAPPGLPVLRVGYTDGQGVVAVPVAIACEGVGSEALKLELKLQVGADDGEALPVAVLCAEEVDDEATKLGPVAP